MEGRRKGSSHTGRPRAAFSKAEIVRAFDDFQAGRLGTTSPQELPHRTAADTGLENGGDGR